MNEKQKLIVNAILSSYRDPVTNRVQIAKAIGQNPDWNNHFKNRKQLHNLVTDERYRRGERPTVSAAEVLGMDAPAAPIRTKTPLANFISPEAQTGLIEALVTARLDNPEPSLKRLICQVATHQGLSERVITRLLGSASFKVRLKDAYRDRLLHQLFAPITVELLPNPGLSPQLLLSHMKDLVSCFAVALDEHQAVELPPHATVKDVFTAGAKVPLEKAIAAVLPTQKPRKPRVAFLASNQGAVKQIVQQHFRGELDSVYIDPSKADYRWSADYIIIWDIRGARVSGMGEHLRHPHYPERIAVIHGGTKLREHVEWCLQDFVKALNRAC